MSAVGDARKRLAGIASSTEGPVPTAAGNFDAELARWQRDAESLTCVADARILALIAALRDEQRGREDAETEHRDLVSRLGFGNDITEPMADNDTIAKWYEDRSAEASEWVESQDWRNDCYMDGHPDDEDCHEHDPALRLTNAEAKIAAAHAYADDMSSRLGGLVACATVAKELRARMGEAS